MNEYLDAPDRVLPYDASKCYADSMENALAVLLTGLGMLGLVAIAPRGVADKVVCTPQGRAASRVYESDDPDLPILLFRSGLPPLDFRPGALKAFLSKVAPALRAEQ